MNYYCYTTQLFWLRVRVIDMLHRQAFNHINFYYFDNCFPDLYELVLNSHDDERIELLGFNRETEYWRLGWVYVGMFKFWE